MADLESLSNNQLREVCMQYNLPNVPVTDSTRKVLTRKLLAAMEQKQMPTNAPSENTVAANYSASDLDYLNNKELRELCVHYDLPNVPVTEKTRRSIINKLIVAMQLQQPAPVPKPPRTRSTTMVQTPTNSPPNNRRTPASPQPVIETYSSAITQKRRSLNEQADTPTQWVQCDQSTPSSRSRSVSLSKTEVLTTSYKQEIEPMYESDEEASDSDLDEQGNAKSGAYISSRYTNHNSSSIISPVSSHNSSSKVAHTNQFLSSTPQSTENKLAYLSKTGVLTTSYNTEITPLRKPHQEEDENENFNDEQHFISDRNSSQKLPLEEPWLQKIYTHPLKSTSYGQVEASYNKSPPIRRHMSSGVSNVSFPRSKVNAVSYKAPEYCEDDSAEDEENELSGSDEVDSIEELSDEPLDSPYASSFARRLNSTKLSSSSPVGRFSSGVVAADVDRESMSARLPPKRPATFESPKRRPPTHVSEADDPVRQFFGQLERKYQLKQTFAVVFFLILAVFIYVFFVQ